MSENKVQITIEAVDKAKGALSDLTKDLKGVETQGKSTGGAMSGLGGVLAGLKSSWLGLSIGVNQALEIFGKIGAAVSKIEEMGEAGAAVMRTEQAFKAVASAAGYMSDEVADSLVKASRGMMDSSDVMQRAGRLMQEGIAPEKLTEMMTLLVRQAPVAGDTVARAWDKIGAALATGNLRMVKQYVGMIDINRELDLYAAKLGTVQSRLSEEAKQAAVFEIVLDKMQETTKKLGPAVDGYAESIQRNKSRIKEAWEEIHKVMVPVYDILLKISAASMEAVLAQPPPATSAFLAGSAKYREQIRARDASGRGTEAEEASLGAAQRAFSSAGGAKSPFAAMNLQERREMEKAVTASILDEEQKRRKEIEDTYQFNLKIWAGEKDGATNAEKIKNNELMKLARELNLKKIALLKETPEPEEDTNASVLAAQALTEKQKADDKERNQKIDEMMIRQQPIITEENQEDAVAYARKREEEERLLDLKREEVILAAELRGMVDEEQPMEAAKAAQESREKNKAILEIKETRNVSFREAEEIKEIWDGVSSSLSSSFKAGFFDLYKNGIRDFKGAWQSFCDMMVQSFSRSLSEMLTNLLTFGNLSGKQEEGGGLLGILKGLLNGLSGSTGSYTAPDWASSSWATSTATVFHGGGIAGKEGRKFWEVAPRFHTGIGPDEIAAVLKRDEGVFTPGQMKAMGVMAQGGGNVSITINAMDSQSIEETLRKNAGAVLGPVLESLKRGGAMRTAMKDAW